jgi:hypothetical protein
MPTGNEDLRKQKGKVFGAQDHVEIKNLHYEKQFEMW